MNTWYYRQADQEVGPFQMEVLEKLRRAGVIDDATPVKNSGAEDWQTLDVALAQESPVASTPSQNEARYYYLDAADQPVGPFDVATLRRLHADQVLGPDTLISGVGDSQWVPAATLLGGGASPVLWAASPVADAAPTHPTYRKLEQFLLMMGVTLTFYRFYLVPCQSRDMQAITGRPRMEFTALLILGILTLGFLLLIMLVLWAFDLERHGKSLKQRGRQESLGIIVLCLAVLSRVLGFAIEDFLPAALVECTLTAGAIWMVQREINLYAPAPEPAA